MPPLARDGRTGDQGAMLFPLSKLLWFLAQPSSLLSLMLAAGLGLALRPQTARLGLRIATSGFALLLVLGLLPVSNLFLLPLEQRFAQPVIADGSRDWAGIIVLGGGEDASVSWARGQLHLNEAAERITEGGLLALRLPTTRLIFTGGAGQVLKPGLSGGDQISAYWQATGIARARILLENQSRNTHENALLTRDLVKPKPGERWLLVTSAYHMPRAPWGCSAAPGSMSSPTPWISARKARPSIWCRISRYQAASGAWTTRRKNGQACSCHGCSGAPARYFPDPCKID